VAAAALVLGSTLIAGCQEQSDGAVPETAATTPVALSGTASAEPAAAETAPTPEPTGAPEPVAPEPSASVVDPAPAVEAPPVATDPQFGTCREAVAAGFGNYVQGVDPEYDWYQDRDHDGVVCETE